MKNHHVGMTHEPQIARLRKNTVGKVGHGKSRSMSNSRLLISTFALLAGLLATYSSVFYVPSFIHFGHILGVSNIETQQAVKDKASGKKSFVRYYADLFKLRRGYFRVGQEIHIDYALSAGDTAKLNIYQCDAPPIVEVFTCEKFIYHSMDGAGKGYSDFMINDPGFYYFDHKIVDQTGVKSNKPFSVMWSRGNFESHAHK